MQVADRTVVSIHYELTNEDGEVLDSSEGQDPLAYLHGYRNIIPGLERALVGKSVGDRFRVTLSPEEAYGERDEALVQTVARSEIDLHGGLKEGMRVEAESPNGRRVYTVSEILGDQVRLDGNHPLAGETLRFAVEVTNIRHATEEELAHGHVHSPGHHH